MKKIQILNWCGLISAVFFSVFNISFHADISILAFPLSAIFTVILARFSIKAFTKDMEFRAVPVTRKMIQYEPYAYLACFIVRRAGNNGTPFALDFICVLFWLVLAVSSFALQYFLSEKRVYSFNENWAKEKSLTKTKKSFALRSFLEAIDWIDALLQAVFMVLLIQIFFFQLYQIPSESMVPEFLINDRVIVGKTVSGPKFPLSEVGLPYLKNYKRGNIVVFRNPHYIIDRKSEIKTFVSQLVYMLSFTKVNLNVDEQGNPKADPLVKRVTGVPGEQLVMQDGVLYARTKESNDFIPVEYDSTKAAWNLNEQPAKIQQNVRYMPIDQQSYDSMLECEKLRRELVLSEVAKECSDISKAFTDLVVKTSGVSTFNKSYTPNLFSSTDMFEFNLFNQSTSVTQKLLTATGGAAWFNNFMTDWISKNDINSTEYVGGDIYSDANFRLNLMIKLTAGKIILRTAQLMLSDLSIEQKNADSERIGYFKTADMLHSYILFLDRRNMPVFPANDKNGNATYIPDNCYLMMGDNRFNSLDMRHSYDETLTALTEHDSYSVTYYSNMAPQYVNRRYILGTTSFRFWPINRAGKL